MDKGEIPYDIKVGRSYDTTKVDPLYDYKYNINFDFSNKRIESFEGINYIRQLALLEDLLEDKCEDVIIISVIFRNNQIQKITSDFINFLQGIQGLYVVDLSNNELKKVDLAIFDPLYESKINIKFNLQNNQINEKEKERILQENEKLNREKEGKIKFIL